MEKLEFDEEKWVYDSSLDFKGRLPLRASTGTWKASLFIIGIKLITSFFNNHLVIYTHTHTLL